MAHIRKSDIKGFTLTYTSQVLTPPIVTVQWDTAMQAIADRYPSTTDYLFPIIKSDDKITKSREIGRVRENADVYEDTFKMMEELGLHTDCDSFNDDIDHLFENKIWIKKDPFEL